MDGWMHGENTEGWENQWRVRGEHLMIKVSRSEETVQEQCRGFTGDDKERKRDKREEGHERGYNEDIRETKTSIKKEK